MPVNKTILLVDDDEDDRMLFSEAFQELHSTHELVKLDNGAELLQYLEKKVPVIPQLIIMDFHMEMGSGEEALTAIRKNRHFCRIPVIIYSGSSGSYQQDPVLKMGANAYVQKPNTYEKTVEVVKSILLLFG